MFVWKCESCPASTKNTLRRPTRKNAKTHTRMTGHTTALFNVGVNANGNRRERCLEIIARNHTEKAAPKKLSDHLPGCAALTTHDKDCDCSPAPDGEGRKEA